jgi:ribonuclease HI
MHAKLRSGDQQRINNNLELAMSTLRTTLILPTTQEHRKLPKTITHKTKKIHASWLQYINHEDLPLGKHTTNETSTSYISLEIVVVLKQANTEDYMNIQTDNSFCMNTIRNYAIDLAAYNNHLHKALLQLTNQLLKDRDLKTHIGKVKSHTGVEYNETADKAARAVVDGENTPDITFEDADPSIEGMRTWP